MAHLESDNAVLTEAFHWAAEKTRQFVMTGRTGPINDGRLPDEIGYAALCGQVVGESRISVTHHGRRRTCLRNQSGTPLLWTACFPGEHREILVDNRHFPAQRLEICGIPLSAVELPVEPGQEVRAELSL